MKVGIRRQGLRRMALVFLVGLMTLVFGGTVMAGGSNDSSAGSAQTLINSLNSVFTTIKNVATSGWVTAFLAVIFIIMVIGYIMNRQDDEMKANFFRFALGAGLIMSAQTVASLVFGALL